MNETPEEVEALQRLLDDSIGSAGAHLTEIITQPRRLSAAQLVNALTGMKVLVLATVTAAGEPRTSCVDGHFLHGTWVFGTAESAHKARHLKARPALSVTHADGERLALFTHGHGDYITPEDPRFAAFDAHFVSHYGSSTLQWSPDPVFIQVRPKWMVGYAMEAAEFPS